MNFKFKSTWNDGIFCAPRVTLLLMLTPAGQSRKEKYFFLKVLTNVRPCTTLNWGFQYTFQFRQVWPPQNPRFLSLCCISYCTACFFSEQKHEFIRPCALFSTQPAIFFHFQLLTVFELGMCTVILELKIHG